MVVPRARPRPWHAQLEVLEVELDLKLPTKQTVKMQPSANPSGPLDFFEVLRMSILSDAWEAQVGARWQHSEAPAGLPDFFDLFFSFFFLRSYICPELTSAS